MKALHRIGWAVATVAIIVAILLGVGLVVFGVAWNCLGHDGAAYIGAGVGLIGVVAGAGPAIYSYFAASKPQRKSRRLKRFYARSAN